MNDTEIKICANCKHYNPSPPLLRGDRYQVCDREYSSTEINIVTGVLQKELLFCTNEREDKYTGILWWKKKVDNCGTEGKYFERK